MGLLQSEKKYLLQGSLPQYVKAPQSNGIEDYLGIRREVLEPALLVEPATQVQPIVQPIAQTTFLAQEEVKAPLPQYIKTGFDIVDGEIKPPNVSELVGGDLFAPPVSQGIAQGVSVISQSQTKNETKLNGETVSGKTVIIRSVSDAFGGSVRAGTAQVGQTVQGAVSKTAGAIGVPNWVFYFGAGLIGVSFLLKARKS